MPVTPELLERAKAGRRDALIALLSDYYPCVHRIAHALTGDEACGRRTVSAIVRRSVAAARNWQHTGDPQRWFIHHTVLASRQRAECEMDLARDSLIRGVATNSAYYPAFIRALRALPMQQREAYILHHGERLDVRGLSIAMDCSQEAAANHLREGTAALSAYGGDFFPAFTAHLTQSYERLSPDEEFILPCVKAALRKRLSSRGVFRFAVNTIKLAVIAAVIFAGWKIVPLLKW